MEQNQMITILKQIPQFQGLSDEDLWKIKDIATLRNMRKKTIIFHEGSEKDAIYFIYSGLVKTYKTDENGHENIVSFLREGDMFPHTLFFESQPYPATAETLVDCQIISMALTQYEQLIVSTPALAIKVMRMMGEKLRELQETLQQITGQDVQNRGISFLLKLADRYGKDLKPNEEIVIPMPITNQEIANTIGTTRETVNRLLNQLRKENIIELKSNQLKILDYDALLHWNSR